MNTSTSITHARIEGPSLFSGFSLPTPHLGCENLNFVGLASFMPPGTFFDFAPIPVIPASTPVFGFNLSDRATPPEVDSNSPPQLKKRKIAEDQPSAAGLVIRAAKKVLLPDLPPAVKTVGVVASAAMTGYKLENNIQDALDEGQPTSEAVVCQSAKTFSEELSGNAFKRIVVSGIPAYYAAVMANPILATTLPVVVPYMINAYKGTQIAAQEIGKLAEKGCRHAFEMARQIAQKEE